MAISSPGIGSNLDVNSIVSQLMALERRPITLLSSKEAKFQAKLSGIGTLKGALSAFQSTVAGLTSAAKFAATKKAAVGDNTILSANASGTAATGTYQLAVTQLAQANKLKSAAYAASNTAIGSGKLTIQFGSVDGAGAFTANADRGAVTIDIASGKNTLADIRDAINAAKAGVTASIVNDGTGYRLSLSSDTSGTKNVLKVAVTDDDGVDTDNAGLSQLAYDPATAGVKNLSQSQEAKDAKFTIDGIEVVKQSNTVSDAVDGLTFTLLKEGSSSVTVSADKSGVKSTIEAFVKAFNDVNKTLKELGGYNAETKQAGVLQGDPTVRTVQTQLRSLLTGQLDYAGGGLRSLSEIGVAFQKDGSLALNSTKLNAVLDDPTKDVATLFASVGKASDSQISVSSVGSTVVPGKYPVEITQLATQGFATDTISSTTVTTGVNDSFGLSINGTSVSVKLAAGTYTETSLAAEIQSKINGSATATSSSLKVAVTASAGVLRIESASFGSSSTVTALSSALLAGTASSTAGIDVAGSIGALAGTGAGQELSGDGNAKGLKIKVTGGPVGIGVDRGTVTYEFGFAGQIDKLLGAMLESKGTLGAKSDGINASIKTLNNQADSLARRMVQIEARYRRQFTSLDTLLSGFNKTSSYLQQQLAALASNN